VHPSGIASYRVPISFDSAFRLPDRCLLPDGSIYIADANALLSPNIAAAENQ
jgi:hypothetical protein